MELNPMPIFIYLLLEENHQRNFMRIERRLLRDYQNPFSIPDGHFINHYRLTKILVTNIIEILAIHTQLPKRSSAIPFHVKVLATLYFLGNGSYQNPVGGSCWACMSQSSISRAISEVCKLISTHLMPDWIKFPTSIQSKNEIKQGFYNKWGFRGVIGAIDGTHVEIIAPPTSDVDHPPFVYINRKGKHSVNVMLITDSDCQILAVDARYPGSVHDAAIWQMSNIRNYLRNEYINGQSNSHLIGDSGYGLEPWLFTPFTNTAEGSPEALFNTMLKSARNVIERTNGILKGRFRCLSRHRVLNYHPAKAAYIIYSCTVLHNIAVKARLQFSEIEDNIYVENNDQDVQHIRDQDENVLTQGREARNTYIALNM